MPIVSLKALQRPEDRVPFQGVLSEVLVVFVPSCLHGYLYSVYLPTAAKQQIEDRKACTVPENLLERKIDHVLCDEGQGPYRLSSATERAARRLKLNLVSYMNVLSWRSLLLAEVVFLRPAFLDSSRLRIR